MMSEPTTKQTTMDRQELQEQFVQQLLDDMDMKTMMCLCYDYMMEGYDKYSFNELKEEVEQYYPEMLEDWKSQKMINLIS